MASWEENRMNKNFEKYTIEELRNRLEELDNKDETIIPANVAEYDNRFNLRNVYGNDNRHFMCMDDSMLSLSFGEGWKKESSVKMIDVKAIKDIKVGDVVRFTDYDNWNESNNEQDFILLLVTKIDGNVLTLQKWDENGSCGFCITRFDMWNNWQVGRKIE